MTDSHSREIRSFNMSRIKAKNTKPELLVRKRLFSMGFRYRLHDKRLPGKPDIYLPKYNTVILINGCFWHRHENCKYATIPKSNENYWNSKIEKNMLRDKKVREELENLGLRVIEIWECELKPSKLDQTITELVGRLK